MCSVGPYEMDSFVVQKQSNTDNVYCSKECVHEPGTEYGTQEAVVS